jgi:PAS domain S-box-containing protein
MQRIANDLTLLIDTANAPIFGIDANGLVNEWNRKAAEITGYTKEEVIGQDLVRKFITAEFQESVNEVLQNALLGRETANFEFPLYTIRGDPVDILLNAATRRGPDNEIVGVVGVGQNITELKQEKLEMSRIAQDLMRLIDYANAPIFGIDTKGRVNEWNRKSVEITGYRREDVIGKNLVQDFITPDYQASVKEVLDNALQGKGTDNFEFPLYSRDGRKVEVLLNATTRVDATNTPIGVIGVGQDITERKTAEQEVSRLAMDLERLIDSANAPILGVDRDGRISEWNQNMSDLSGYSKSAVLGIPLATCDFIDVENRTSVGDVLARALEGVDCRNLEFSINSKDGRRVELLLNAATRRDAQGSIVGVVGVGQDITEKKYMEKAEINAAKMRASNDAKGNFLASMSHEMRTPLNGVLGMLQLAMSYELPQEVRKNVQNAYMSGEHLLNLVNDILDVSKIEAGKLELEMKPFSVTEVYRAAMGIVRPQAAAKGLIMELEIAQDLPLYARGDQQRIRQVLLNLLYNAVKFTVRGSVTLSVGVKETTPTHYCLTTSVSDTGIGMDEPSQKKLFGMFIKIKDARVRNPLGVGLGLAICKQLVELMGGSIWVESEYGTGSSFSFTLKVERADAESDIQMVEEEMLSQHSLDVGEADMQPATILVAEDNEFNMEVVKTMLQSMGHTVDIVWDGSECLDCLFDSGGQPMLHAQFPSRLKYDLIFMDCNMPVMDGYEACRLIRKSEAQFGLAPVPIVALTAYAMPGDRDKCLDNGMTDYLTKPMSKQALRKMVSRYAPVGQQTDATRTTPISGRSSLNDTPKQSSRSMMIPAVYPGSRGVVNYVPVKTPLSTGMEVGQPRAPSTSTSSAFRVRGDGTSGASPLSPRSSGRRASKEGVPRLASVVARDSERGARPSRDRRDLTERNSSENGQELQSTMHRRRIEGQSGTNSSYEVPSASSSSDGSGPKLAEAVESYVGLAQGCAVSAAGSNHMAKGGATGAVLSSMRASTQREPSLEPSMLLMTRLKNTLAKVHVAVRLSDTKALKEAATAARLIAGFLGAAPLQEALAELLAIRPDETLERIRPLVEAVEREAGRLPDAPLPDAPLPDAPPEERKGGVRLVPELCASPMASTKPIESVLDYKRALAQLGGDETLMRRMLLHFISYSRSIPSKLISALSSGAFDVVRREAHSLKGSASFIGATVVPELAEKLQLAAGEADLRQVSSLIGELGHALDMLRRDAERHASPQDAHYSACAQDESSTAHHDAHGQSEAEVERRANTSSRQQRRSESSGDSQLSRDARSTDGDVEEAVAAETRILSDDTCAGPTVDMSARVDIEDEPTRELMQGGHLAKMASLLEALFIAADVDGLSSDAFLSAAERMHACVLLSAAEHDVLLSDGFELLRLLHLLPKDLAHVTDVDAVLRRLALHVEARDWPERRESLQGSNDLALRMYCDDPGVLERMKATFASQAVDLLGRVSESVANGNLRRAGLEAHSLRGMAMYIGNPQIAAAALTLETAATSGVADGALVTALLQRLRHEVLTVCQSEPATASAQGDERRFTSLSQLRVEHLINILARRSIGYFMERLTHADCLPDCKLIASLIAS